MIDLLDPRLFGNEAGDDEDDQTLSSYFVEKAEFASFLSDSVKFAVCRARKGMGKSALLTYTIYSKGQVKGDTVVKIWGPHLVGSLDSKLHAYEWIAEWKRTLAAFIPQAVEKEERSSSLGIGGFAAAKSLAHPGPNGKLIWVCIDDVDATYRKSESEDLRLAAFFSACRDFVRDNLQVRLRVSVRQDVWASIRTTDEALDKCEQYMTDISWSRSGTRSIVAKRIMHYVSVTDGHRAGRGAVRGSGRQGESAHDLSQQIKTSWNMIFPEKYPTWGGTMVPPHTVVHTLAAGRPRWALQLVRMAAAVAVQNNDTLLKFGHLKQILPRYSRFRVNDLIREHVHQCERIEDAVYGFMHAPCDFSTAKLLSYVEENLCRQVAFIIDRRDEAANFLELAHFLFRIGFIEAVTKADKTIIIRFDDSPHLLRSLTARHDYMEWGVAIPYRAALNINSDKGFMNEDDRDA